ncbi:hypothetical protein ACLKA6_010696 [Drosophila palustris]
MSTSMICARNSLIQQGSELSALTIQQQQLQLRQQQQISDVAATPNMLIEDEVHGVIEIPSYIEEIVNHPQFQRLKKVKQTGLLWMSGNPNGDHTRYDHCIGTFKGAQDQLNALRRNSINKPELPEWCRRSVEIAALLHDVGHGPFSHNWEEACGHSFDHELNGLICVDQIFADVKTPELLSLRDDCNGRGVQLIKALIRGDSEMLSFPMMEFGYIFDIVHNSRCGLDVDKWDYIRRDNKRLHLLNEEQLQFDDVFLKSRISPDGERIEYRYDDYHLIYKLFVARWTLHVGAYQLPKNLAFDHLLTKILRRCQTKLCDLRGDSSGWLDLNDDSVLEMIASDPQAIYLSSPERWIETASCDDQNGECICVKTEKLGPGVDMKPDECYALYGDKSKKRSITRQMTSTPISGCFKLQ